MKKTLTAAVAALILATSLPAYAAHRVDVETPESRVTYDVLLMRPFGLIAVGAGVAAFVIGLPFTALLGESGRSAEELVVAPFNHTFTRPIGDMGPFDVNTYDRDLPRSYRTYPVIDDAFDRPIGRSILDD